MAVAVVLVLGEGGGRRKGGKKLIGIVSVVVLVLVASTPERRSTPRARGQRLPNNCRIFSSVSGLGREEVHLGGADSRCPCMVRSTQSGVDVD